MVMRKIRLSALLFSLIILFSFSGGKISKYQDPNFPVETRVNDLLSKMTIEEKVAQMMNNAPAIPRLGIPAYNWWNEALHGVARSPYHTTSYPQAIAMAATWDTASLHLMADYTATEGRAIFNDASKKGNVGIYCGLTYWTPNINIFRDPRWGRGQETYGEDPYLTATMGKAFVTGLQGNDPVYLKASACTKHYAVHSGPESTRHTYNAVVSKYDLWDTYLPAFRALVTEAHVSGVMCAYNALDGKPCCGSDQLMNAILRNQWNFDGYVTSDCGAINNFYRTHKTSPDAQSAAADAVLHGTDVECGSVYKSLLTAFKEGLITEDQIDVSLRRLFTIRFRLGMFDAADRVPFSDISLSELESSAHKDHALKMARQSIVLLKNDNHTLPLRKNLKTIAIVGPNADDESVLLANYYGIPSEITTILEGIKAKVGPGTRIIYEKGVNLTDNKVFKPSFDPSLFTYNGKKGFIAEYFNNRNFEGNPVLSRLEEKIDYQWGDGEKIAENIIARNIGIRWKTVFTPTQDGKAGFQLKGDDGCRLFINGQKVLDSNQSQTYYNFDAEKGKNYELVIEYWQDSENASISFTNGFVEETEPAVIASRVKSADLIIYAGGISASLEGEEMRVQIEGFSGGDRTSLSLPKVQEELLKALKGTGKPVVFVMMTGSAMGIGNVSEGIPAIVNAWYGGEAAGTAVADVLFGDYNPAGRLPVTFYKSVNDLPGFEDYNMENRTYRYFKGEPLYPFGYGLSYTTFKYDNLEIPVLTTDGKATVRVRVKNTGKMDGEEVIQLYLSHRNPGMKSPIRALKGFTRINLKAGESRIVEFRLGQEELSIVDENGIRIVMPGELELSIGGGQPSPAMLKSGNVVQKVVPVNGELITLGN
jgi:beta-glucosidase